MNYIWCGSAQLFLSYGFHKIPGAFVGTMWARWANDYNIVNVLDKADPMNLIWSESAQWLLSSGICKFQECPCIRQDGSIELDLEWMGPVDADYLNTTWARWANDHDVAHLQAKTFPMNLIWGESAQWLLSYDIYKFPRALIMSVGKPMWPQWANGHDETHVQAKTIPMNSIGVNPPSDCWVPVPASRVGVNSIFSIQFQFRYFQFQFHYSQKVSIPISEISIPIPIPEISNPGNLNSGNDLWCLLWNWL